MKVIKYQVIGYTDVWNPETEEVERKECLAGMERPYTEEAYQKALAKAYNGEVTVEDAPDPEREPTTEERISALEESKANQTEVDELNEALDLILSGVTE